MIGRKLAHYRITAAIGAGGMGEIYRATDTRLGRDVALKVMPAEMAAEPERLERFRREAKALAALDHPGIVAVYSVEEAAGVHFLTMQLVEGQPLDRLIPEGGMARDELLAIASALAEALAAAHERGIVHRDLKPANVMVTQDGRVKLVDFGLAKVAARADEAISELPTEMRTREGIVMGTVPYMSPEQIEGNPVDHRSDIFSFGIVLYELAAGARPFSGKTSPALLSSILRDTPAPLTRSRPDLPRQLERIVSRCLAKNVRERYQTSRQLHVELTALQSGTSRVAISGGEEPGHTQLPNNLPSALDSFVGRHREIGEIIELFVHSRLLTVTGVGGTGKTRLAIEAAARLLPDFTDGAWLVELAPVTQAEAVPHVVADVVGAKQQPHRTMIESVAEALRHRSLLLVLDNCEHVLDAAAALASAITTHCAGVRVLATSRESLAIRGEQLMRLQSLSPGEGAELFRDRARAAGTSRAMNPQTLARLSDRLDGIPLAIELAAARCGSMSPEEIEQRLDDRFRLLRGSRRGRMERHQTLRNTVAWSYDLLQDSEQRVFDRLSAFAGGFDLAAARAIAGGDDTDGLGVEDALFGLVERSMVLAADSEDGTRYRLLETLRQFGEERLIDSGDGARVRDRQVEWFTRFMRGAWTGLWSADDAYWIRAIGYEFENLRAAINAAIDDHRHEAVGAMLKPLYWWAWQSLRYEAGDWAEAALALDPEPPNARAVAVHLLALGGRLDDAVRLAPGLESSSAADLDEACLRAQARWSVDAVAGEPDLDAVIRHVAETAVRTGVRAWATTLKSIEVPFAVMAGRMDEARRIAAEAVEEAEALGNVTALSWAYFASGRAHSDGDPERALASFDRSCELAERHRLPMVGGIAATEAAAVIARVGEPGRGWARLSRALRSFLVSGDLPQLWTSAHHLVLFLIRAGRMEEARAVWEGLGSRPAFTARHHREELAQRLGDPGTHMLSDSEAIQRIRAVLDELDRKQGPLA